MSIRRAVRRLALGATAGLIGRAVARRRRLIAPVARVFRSPALWLPWPFANDRGLKIMRSLLQRTRRPVHSGVTVETHFTSRRDGGRIRMLVHEPDERVRPSGALCWIHGGGLILGIPEQSNETCSWLARELGVLVVAVDYRLAPEDPYPAGLDDCVDALRWLHERADDFGVDPTRVAVGGDSAGGGLAASVCQRVLDEGGPSVAFQGLIYPMLDDRTVLRQDNEGRGNFIWTPELNAYGWTAYLGYAPRLDETRPYVAAARRADLSGLPPAWIGVGDLDLFYEEDVAYARRLEAAGVPCELLVVPGMYHGADGFVPKAAECREFRAALTSALRRAVGAEPAVYA